jgi:transaldolase
MLESLILQAGNGTAGGITTGNPQIDSIVAIILAIGSIAGLIGHFLSTQTRFKRQGQYMTTFGQKTVEQEQNIAAIGNAVVGASPEVAAKLAEQGKTLDELRRRAEIAEAQLKKLSSNIPESAQADNKEDLPR